ncbi:MAG: glutathione S-transferase family protein [Alphaproteobacteria bacterium]|nr:glutathione S-transferase family protein [Alphaproteobacteria bacterium]
MGLLVNGEWKDRWYDTKTSGGRFVRQDASFRGRIGEGEVLPAAPGRYHLYVSWACPWAHRTLLFRALKGLTEVISVSVVEPLMLEDGWTFSEALPDHLYGHGFLHQLYTRAKPDYTGRVTVPVLWDRETGRIVNNESSEIIRIFNRAFDAWGDASLDLWPEDLREEIEAVNQRVYHTVNNGVYKAGFATTQSAYEEAVTALFETLDWLEERLSAQPWLVGDRLTEADWRLFTTLVRFDPVYHGHFKCNLRRLVDFPNLWSYTRALYQAPGVAETVHLDHIKRHYYASHRTINPTGIVPLGPALDLNAPHDRGRFGRAGADPLWTARRG